MKGEVLHYDDDAGTGQISGADGIRYNFTRADLKQLVPISRGSKVDFDFEGKQAKDIYLDSAATPARAMGSPAGMTPYTGEIEPRRGLWGYFWRCVTSYFANFYGRASRKEYWGFTLFYILTFIVLGIIFSLVAAGGAGASATPGNGGVGTVIAAIGVLGLSVLSIVWLILLIPSVAVLVRRFHDVGQSGWVALLLYVLGYLLSIFLIGFVCFIIIFVICCLRGQPGENKYGPPVTPQA